MAINLSRNTRVWISTVTSGHNNSNTFEIPVQEDYSLSQAVATADVSAEEAGPTPTRGGKRFNTNLDPVEWSFSTYFNPYLETGDAESNVFNFAVDMLMWHALASSRSVAPDFDDSNWDSAAPSANGAEVSGDTTRFRVGFADNSAHVLTELYIYFKIDNDMYLVNKAQVGQAEISIDISDISMTSWSGNALSYTKIPDPAFIAAGGAPYDASSPTAGYVQIPDNKAYIINKLTTMDFQSDVTGSTLWYNVPITAGTLTINNNVTYLTPSTLAQVDTPVGSFTGAFEVSGSFDAYMRSTGLDGVTEGNAKGTTELLEDMLANTDRITNTTNTTMYIGGETSGTPQVKITMPTLHVAVPTLSTEDVISTSIEFKAIPTSSDLLSGDELVIEMTPAQA